MERTQAHVFTLCLCGSTAFFRVNQQESLSCKRPGRHAPIALAAAAALGLGLAQAQTPAPAPTPATAAPAGAQITIREIEWDNGRYEVKARNAQDERVKLYVNARSGEVEHTRTDK